MSRYTLKIEDSTRVFVGWDNPLQTFFVQKYLNYNQPDEELILDFGNHFKEMISLDYLVNYLWRQGYDLSDYLYNSLWDDWANKTEPTPLQKKMNEFFDSFDKNNKTKIL